MIFRLAQVQVFLILSLVFALTFTAISFLERFNQRAVITLEHMPNMSPALLATQEREDQAKK